MIIYFYVFCMALNSFMVICIVFFMSEESGIIQIQNYRYIKITHQ